MLDRMPVADEETIRNRRARFRKDDVREQEAIGCALVLNFLGGGSVQFCRSDPPKKCFVVVVVHFVLICNR